MSFFISDSLSALQRASVLDQSIESNASQISADYVDLVCLASRQVMAGMEITVGLDLQGQLNLSDILIFC